MRQTFTLSLSPREKLVTNYPNVMFLVCYLGKKTMHAQIEQANSNQKGPQLGFELMACSLKAALQTVLPLYNSIKFYSIYLYSTITTDVISGHCTTWWILTEHYQHQGSLLFFASHVVYEVEQYCVHRDPVTSNNSKNIKRNSKQGSKV